MTERQLQAAILELAKLLGWRVMHQRPARTLNNGYKTAIEGHTGFPDLVMLRPPRLVFAELKTDKGRVTHEQALWINGLARSGGPQVSAYLWRPKNWESGEIEDILR